MTDSPDTTIASAIPRRGFLRQLAAASSLAAAGPAAALAAPPTAAIHELWNRMRSFHEPLQVAQAAESAAYDRLAWWAAVGPAYINHEGEQVGEENAWPAIIGMAPPEHKGVFRLIRPTPRTLRQNYEFDLSMGSRDTKRATARYRKKLRELAARKKEQEAERVRAGLAEAEKTIGELYAECDPLRTTIDRIDDGSPDAIAAKLLNGVLYEKDASKSTQVAIECVKPALMALQPRLTGMIAVDVAALLAQPNLLFGDHAWYV